MKFFVRTLLCLICLSLSLTLRAENSDGLSVAAFEADVTPPMGHPLCGGTIKEVVGVDDPELAKGIILRDAKGTYVLCAVDWCELVNDAYDSFRRKLADAAGTIPTRVALQCLHQHNALIADSGAQTLLDQFPGAPKHLDLAWYDQVTSNVAEAAKKALLNGKRATRVGTSMAKADRVASTRRVKGPDGKIQVRWSATKEKEVRDAPEGLIDPFVRTITFADDRGPIVQLHYYATHPMSYYGDGRVTWDVPGIARERLEKETGVFQVYFTGCAGDITMGKYNDGAPELRQELAGRLYDTMKQSVAEVKFQPVTPIQWKKFDVKFPILKDPKLDEEIQRKALADPQGAVASRINAATAITWIEREKAERPIELTAFSIGSIRVVHLPGEPFITFQLGAQEKRPDSFVCVAGYGNGGPGYICTKKSFGEGGYEPSASNVAPESEGILREAISVLLEADDH